MFLVSPARSCAFVLAFILAFSCLAVLASSNRPLQAPFLPLAQRPRPFELAESYAGSHFFDKWDYETIDDPTHGFTDYLSRDEAFRRNRTFVGSFDGISYIYPDFDSSRIARRGRGTIRLLSKAEYEAETVIIIDLLHMPVGCGVWPAFWTTSLRDWPNMGEVDIIENVHIETQNLHTLHTSQGCMMPDRGRRQTGATETSDCDVNAPNQYANQGCGVRVASPSSWGHPFNAGGGGYVALVWTEDGGMAFYDFPRGRAPLDLAREDKEIDPSKWGTPTAHFPATLCPMSRHFRAQHLILNIAFCGDWAGQPAIWAQSGCSKPRDPRTETCERSVREGVGLEQAYWGVRRISVYKRDPTQERLIPSHVVSRKEGLRSSPRDEHSDGPGSPDAGCGGGRGPGDRGSAFLARLRKIGEALKRFG